MNVKELIELLKKVDPKMIVALSSDEEGNTIRPMCNDEPYNCGKGIVHPDWDREIEQIHPDDLSEYDINDVFDVIIFYP